MGGLDEQDAASSGAAGGDFPIGRCCCSPARSKHCEMHQLWLGTGLQQVSFKNRTWCGRRIKPGAWPAKSTRRSSSPWAVPETRPRPWPEPCRALSGERVTGNQLRCTATRPSPSIRSSARSVCSGSDSLPRSLADVALQLTESLSGISRRITAAIERGRGLPAGPGSVSRARCLRLPVVLARQGGPSTARRMMTQRLDPRSDRPLALQLADLLRAEIQEGRRRPGSQLPTESAFQAEYGVSRTTIRTALATLASEGLVLTRKGFGSYVRDRPALRRISSTHRHASHRESGKPEFDTEAIAQGQVPSRRMLEIGTGFGPAGHRVLAAGPAGPGSGGPAAAAAARRGARRHLGELLPALARRGYPAGISRTRCPRGRTT